MEGAAEYLKELLARTESLPSDLRSTFGTIKELDTQVHDTIEALDGECETLLSSIAEMPAETRRTELSRLQNMFDQALEASDQKVALATKAYDEVDNHIRRLDEDLLKRGAGHGAVDAAGMRSFGDALVEDMPVDPNEPTYCLCHQVSFGEMIACDNPACPTEWFHYNCVNLKTKPKGKWFCPMCRADQL
eukprot:m.7549 g.7549  ORF g.7549 m.7549 type:complete len:190 (-) comp5261_c0_seq2:1748-2317(-)